MKISLLSLPDRSQVFRAFLALIAPVFIWSLIFFFRELPSYLLRLRVWEILGVFSYVQVIALIDGLILTIFSGTITIFLPIKSLRSQFASTATILGYLTALSVIPFALKNSDANIASLISKLWFPWIWVLALIGFAGVLLYSTIKSDRFQQAVLVFIDKISVLSTLYLLTSLAGIAVILARIIGLR